MRTREEINELRRKRRALYGNVYEKKYINTINGFLVRVYQNMKGRTSGLQKKDYPHLYKGKELLDRQVFYDWSKQNEAFKTLYQQYIDSGRDKKLVPSIDRIDTEKGYTIDNIQWITFSENCRKAKKVNKFCGERSKESIARQIETVMAKHRTNFKRLSDGKVFYLSPTEMCNMFGGSRSSYYKLKSGAIKTTNGFAHIHVEKNGDFEVRNLQITNGKVL